MAAREARAHSGAQAAAADRARRVVELTPPSLADFGRCRRDDSAHLIYFDPVVTAEGFARKSGPLYPLYALYVLLVWGLALATLIAKWRAARGVARVQLRYVAWAFLLSGLGGLTTNLILPWLTGRSTYSWFGPYFGVVLIALIAHTIIRHRLMDLRLVVHRGLSMTLATVVVLIPVGTLVVLMWPRFADRLQTSE